MNTVSLYEYCVLDTAHLQVNQVVTMLSSIEKYCQVTMCFADVRAIIMHQRKIYHANLGHPYSSRRSRILLAILLARERAAAASMERILGSCMHIMKD